MANFIVEGVGQNLPKPPEPVRRPSRFEDLFSESQKMIENFEFKNVKIEEIPDSIDQLELTCPVLNNDPLFTKLKSGLESFNKELDLQILNKEHIIDDLDFKTNIFDCLRKLMQEIITTTDRVIQRDYLARVYNWFMKKFESRKKKSKLGAFMAPVPRPPPKGNPILAIREKALYESKMRTIHPEINPAKDRLRDYKVKTLEIIEEHERREVIPQPPIEELKPKKTFYTHEKAKVFYIQESEGIEGKSAYMNYQPSDDIEEQKLTKKWLSNQNKEIQEKRAEEEFREVMREWAHSKARVDEELTRKHEALHFGSNFEVRNTPVVRQVKSAGLTTADYEEIYNAPSSEEEEDSDSEGVIKEEEEESHGSPGSPGSPKKGILFPGEVPPVMCDLTLRPMSEQGDLPPPLPPKKKRGPVIPEMLTKRPPTMPDAATADIDASKRRIAKLRATEGHLIRTQNNNMEDVDNIFHNPITAGDAISLSVYNNHNGFNGTQDVRLPPINRQRPFTTQSGMRQLTREVPICHMNLRDHFRMEQYEEINKIKEHLAREDIPCSISTVQRAILMPQDIPVSHMSAAFFPEPGARLMINEFKRKKKKKGKKKGKKGGKKKKKK